MKNFASEAVEMKVKGKDMKVKEIQASRDLFGRSIHLAPDNDMDFAKVLAHPLTPILSYLGYLNGMINKPEKSALLRKLENNVSSLPPPNVDACIIDAMFCLRSMSDLPATYGEVAKAILSKICTHSKLIDFVCDTYISPSFQDNERHMRDVMRLTLLLPVLNINSLVTSVKY